MSNVEQAIEILETMRSELREVAALEERVAAGESAWQEGTDPFEMAGCDPAAQFVISQEIDKRMENVRALAGELDEALGRKSA